jgi:type VI secretion system secreted protein Hcp
MKRSLLLSLLAPVVAAGSLHAASDYLLEIDGIKGESSDDRHAQAMEIESFSWGTTNGTNGATSGVDHTIDVPIYVIRRMSIATPPLLLACATGQHYPKATLFVRKAGAAGAPLEDYYKIELEDVLVTSFSQSAPTRTSSSGDVVPTDRISLTYGKITLSYTGPDGTVTTATVVRTPPRQ